MKLTKSRLKEIIKEELLREEAEIEDVQDHESRIFDAIIKQLMKLEVRLSQAIRDTQK